jgi:poly(A) polymerase
MSQAFSNAKPSKQRVNPINFDVPTVGDIALNEALNSYLHAVGTFESAEMAKERVRVLGYLFGLVKKWGKMVWDKKGLPDGKLHDSSPKLHTFGSYRLGAHDPNGDIDTLCILPQHIERDDFFDSLYDILRAESDITNITPIPNAKVPVMQMEICGISIDLTCARLQQAVIPENLNLSPPKLLMMCADVTDRLSLNGPRVTDEILNLVPSKDNFRLTLRSIKRWAKSRAIYCNALGFPGGVSWAMLTAQICQFYPTALPATLLCKFFTIYTQWPWPNPVLLTDIQIGGQFGSEVWSQKNVDKQALMPVITPTYPAFNSTYNISQSTKAAIIKEFARGYMITSAIEKGEKQWSELFTQFPFFTSFPVYIRINCTAYSKEECLKLSGLVESRIRFMINVLDQTDGMSYVHPYSEAINFVNDADPTSINCAYFLGITFQPGVKQVNFSPATIYFKEKVEKFKAPESEVTIQAVVRNKLPDWVFQNGVRPKKANTKKRTLAREDPDVQTKKTKLDAKGNMEIESSNTTSTTSTTTCSEVGCTTDLNSTPKIEETIIINSSDTIPITNNPDDSSTAVESTTSCPSSNNLIC